MRGAGPTPEKEDYSLNVINEMDIVLSNMNYPVIFLLFCWGAADSGVALPEPFPEARGPVYGCGVTPQGRSRGRGFRGNGKILAGSEPERRKEKRAANGFRTLFPGIPTWGASGINGATGAAA